MRSVASRIRLPECVCCPVFIISFSAILQSFARPQGGGGENKKEKEKNTRERERESWLVNVGVFTYSKLGCIRTITIRNFYTPILLYTRCIIIKRSEILLALLMKLDSALLRGRALLFKFSNRLGKIFIYRVSSRVDAR